MVLAISTNFGQISQDLMNRALPIHLNPVGDLADRQSPIGDPKLEYLPANAECIAAELRGMVERWKDAGRPADFGVRHPFALWARLIGGILRVNGYRDFLANYRLRRTADDPERNAIALLGATRPDKWLRVGEWVAQTAALGLTRVLIGDASRDGHTACERRLGCVLSAHLDETFETVTEEERLSLRLKRTRTRNRSEPATRYRFEVLSREAIPEDASSGA